MKTKHTPGPWHATKDDPESDRQFVSSEQDGAFYDVAEIIGGTLADDSDANAALIAAAPDMLEYLKRLESYLSLTDEEWAEYRALISKAEGRDK